MKKTGLLVLLILLSLLLLAGCRSYYYDEIKGECWADLNELEEPVYLGEMHTVEQALENAEEALRYYFGEDTKLRKHKPFGLNYFVDEDIWLVFTEYDPDRVGGGIAFTIDGETGELSDYELQE